jgi:hypothetical protein
MTMTKSRFTTLFGAPAKEADFEEVYRQELPRIFNFFRYQFGDETIAEDLTAAQYLDNGQVPYGWGIFATYRTAEGDYLSIHTNRFDGRQQDVPMGGRQITDVQVNGKPGVWIEDLPFSGETINMLLWEMDGYVLAIQSNQLSLEEVLELAQTLKQ